MTPLRELALGLGLAGLLGIAGYCGALAEPRAAIARDEHKLAAMQRNLDDARAVARAQGHLQALNQRLRRATGTAASGTAKQSFAGALAQLTGELTQAGGIVSGIYPQEGRAACGLRVLVTADRAVTLVQQIEQAMAWHCARLEAKRTDDGRLELYFLLEQTR